MGPLSNDVALDVRGLTTTFRTDAGPLRAVDGVDFSLRRGQITAVVGESGCGKSVTALSIMRLLPPSASTAGDVLLGGTVALHACSAAAMRRHRGKDLAMVFQDAQTSLNPVLTIGQQLSEAITVHEAVSSRMAVARVITMLERVGVPEPELRLRAYPHELSGGLKQRAMIAMSLLCRPAVLIADEPTTALDVTIQAQILDLIKELRDDPSLQMAIMFITHDMGVVADIAQDVIVMYAGRIVERGSVDTVLRNPKHPYTRALLKSIPVLGERRQKLEVIGGQPPNLHRLPPGCAFGPRCASVTDACRAAMPALRTVAPEHDIRCILEVNP